jgi:hypothetical protein
MTACIFTMNAAKFKSDFYLMDRPQEIYWRKELQTDNYIFVLKYRIT